LRYSIAEKSSNKSDPLSEEFVKISVNDLKDKSDKKEIDMETIQLDWMSSRKTCLCTNQIDLMSRKLNCTKCGQIFCERCVEDGEYLPSNSSGKLMFICKKCLGIS
jgi:hypothetical protein